MITNQLKLYAQVGEVLWDFCLLQNQYCRGDYVQHDLNVTKILEAPRKLNDSIFTLTQSDWLFNQDKEFTDWFYWLLDIFLEIRDAMKVDFLENIFLLHQKFLNHQP